MKKTAVTTNVAITIICVLSLFLAACQANTEATSDTVNTNGEDESADPGLVTDLRENDEAFEALVAAAEDEGSVVWYTSHQTGQVEEIAERFEAEYGIEVIYQRSGGEEILQQFLLEADQGEPQNDVLATLDPEAFATLLEEGYLACFAPRNFDRLHDWAKGADECYGSHRGSAMVMSYRTDIVENPPTAYADLLDEQYRGMIAHGNPEFGGIIRSATVMTVDQLGPEYYEELAGLDPLIFQGNSQLADAIMTGERPIVMSSAITHIQQAIDDGAPIEYTYPEDGGMFSHGPVAVVEGAQNPAAARLLVDFIISDEIQEWQATEQSTHSTLADVDPPEGMESLEDTGVPPVDIELINEEGDALVDQFTEAMGTANEG